MATHTAVVFDCDGVLLDSNELKIELFRQTALDANYSAEQVDRFATHVASNFGTSRFRLFEWLVQQTTGEPTLDRVTELSEAFSASLDNAYSRAPATPGMEATIRILARQFRLFVVSGSEQGQLRRELAHRGLGDLFEAIYGSPQSKTDNLLRVTRAVLPEASSTVVVVGDAEADLRAATDCGATFVFMEHFSTAKEVMRSLAVNEAFPVIQTLAELPRLLDVPIRSGSFEPDVRCVAFS